MISNETPYISVVIVGRNDNYGENFLQRLNTFVKSLDYQVRDYPGLMELIVVEWNPLPDKPRITEVIAECANLPTRIIAVDKEQHDRIGHSKPVLEFYGKNVGARRARGQFILTTNPDIIFTEELIAELAQRQLQTDRIYRTDRFDFYSNGIENVEPKDYVKFALNNTFSGHFITDGGSASLQVSNVYSLNELPASNITRPVPHTNAAGDFILASQNAFFMAGGLLESTDVHFHLDGYSVARFLLNGYHQGLFVRPACIFHQHHNRAPVTDPWTRENVMKYGSARGLPNWGLDGVKLEEWINYASTGH